MIVRLALFRWPFKSHYHASKSIFLKTQQNLGKKELFKGLWIDQSDWDWQTYPVIHLDMTAAASAGYDVHQVRHALENELLKVAKSYGVEDTQDAQVPVFFGNLLQALSEKTGQQVVVIIDEYDKPLLDVLGNSDSYLAIHELLSAMYGQLKRSSPYLRFVLLTGVFKFAKTSVFSGLNNLKDLTFDPKAAELLGYTEQEIKDNFPEQLDGLCRKLSKTRVELIEVLKEQYNGYSFGVDTDTGEIIGSVYNPFALNYVFVEQQLLERWFASGTPTLLIKKLKEQSFGGIDPSALTVQFRMLEDSCGPSDITALSLLYYAGYLTLRAYNFRQKKITLDFPNAEVAQAFSSSLLSAISSKDETLFGAITSKINDLLYSENLEELKGVLNQALAQMPYFMFGTRESYYQTVIYLFFNASSVVTIAEDMMNRGRADITVLLPQAIYIFELKMNQSSSVALQQIKDRGYAEKYRHLGRRMYAVGIMLSSKKRVVQEILLEVI